MQNPTIQAASTAVGVFASVAIKIAKTNPDILRETAPVFIDHVITAIFRDHYRPGDAAQRLFPGIRDAMANGTFHDEIIATAANPVFQLEDAGPHLRFAEAWYCYALGMLTLEALDDDDVTVEPKTLGIACCHLLSLWKKAGYRLDWHPVREETQVPTANAPLGNWSKLSK